MAVTSAELKKLQKQVSELQKLLPQVTQLQKRVTELEQAKQQIRRPIRKTLNGLSERERAIQILRRAGITREPTAKEKQLAARWRARSPQEKKQVEDALRAVKIDPPLSQLIHDMRR